MAIEEYIFSRYYMYQNVYLHKTTRGYEKLLEAMWRKAKHLHELDPKDVQIVPVLERFWASENPSVKEYVDIEEFTVLSQIQVWTSNKNASLADLANRFLARNGFVMVEPPRPQDELTMDYRDWEAAAHKILRENGFQDAEMYCLPDTLKGKYRQPYIPEKESDQQSVRNAIRVLPPGGGTPIEISQVMTRLQAVTTKTPDQRRYYVPREVREPIQKLVKNWKS